MARIGFSAFLGQHVQGARLYRALSESFWQLLRPLSCQTALTVYQLLGVDQVEEAYAPDFYQYVGPTNVEQWTRIVDLQEELRAVKVRAFCFLLLLAGSAKQGAAWQCRQCRAGVPSPTTADWLLRALSVVNCHQQCTCPAQECTQQSSVPAERECKASQGAAA